jgi:hypothetical protein
MLKVGDCIRVKTKTLNDLFGEVVYRVEEVGLPCVDCKKNDAIRFVMLGGSGPSARAGYPITDCFQRVRREVSTGVTQILNQQQAGAALKFYALEGVPRPGGELEM